MRILVKTLGICTRTKYVTKKSYKNLFSFLVQVKMRHIIENLHRVRFSGSRSCRHLSLVFPLTQSFTPRYEPWGILKVSQLLVDF